VDKAPDAFRTISEVADELDVPQHVLRFWETRFPQIKPMKRGGGRRYYRPDDVALLRGVRHLLYGEGYTIRGVQRLLKDNGLKFVQSVWRSGLAQPDMPRGDDAKATETMSRAEAVDPAVTEDVPPPRRETGEPPESPQRTGSRRDTSFRAAQAAQPAVMHSPPPTPPAGPAAIGPEELPEHATVSVAPAPALSPGDMRRLQAALHELGECRRLIETALKDE